MQKKAYNSKMVRDMAKGKCTAASKAFSNFSSEECRPSFRIKRRGVSPCGLMVGFLFRKRDNQRLRPVFRPLFTGTDFLTNDS